mgnify:FL=1
MIQIGRRRFCALLGAGFGGLTGLLGAGCSDAGGDTAPAPTGSDPELTGLSLKVRVDPG